MIQRFSFYQDPMEWSGDIVEDVGGRWVRWKDVVPYIEYAEGHGFILPEEVLPAQALLPMVDLTDALPEDMEDEDEVDDDMDLYDVMLARPLVDEPEQGC